MPPLMPEQLTTDSESPLQQWQELPDDDPNAVVEHLAKLRALASYLNANFSVEIPTA
jgi:hypothetical protein